MKEYATEQLRNVILLGHGSSGKTSLAEAMLHTSGGTSRLGRVEDGTSVADFEEDERARRISINTALVACEYAGVKINLLDTPGFTDFVGEVKSAIRVADAAIIIVDAVAGVEVGTQLVWEFCEEHRLPRFVVINKMDRDNANYTSALASVQQLAVDKKLVPAQLPWGEKAEFKGIIGLLSEQARKGVGTEEEEIPNDLSEIAAEARVALEEAAAEGDDDLLLKYLDGQPLNQDEIKTGFKKAVLAGTFVPVFLASSTSEIGIDPILQGIIRYLPSPDEQSHVSAEGIAGIEEVDISDAGPLGVYAFKTTADPYVGKLTYLRVMSGMLDSDTRVYNHHRSSGERIGTLHVMRGKEQIPVQRLHAGDLGTVAKLADTATGDTLGEKTHPLKFPQANYPGKLYAVAVRPSTQGDSAKMGPTLTRLCEEDPTLTWRNEASTRETILEGMGDQHIEVAVRRAQSKFGTALEISTPKVPYRETISRSSESSYRHKKQSGGAGQFAEVHIRVEPLNAENIESNGDENFRFKTEVFGGAISSSYLPAIEKGIRSIMQEGVIAGYPVQKVFVAVTDGKEHPVDSKPIAFEIAGREAFKLAVKNAGPAMLEPIVLLEVVVPEANMGDVLGDLNTRRARVQGMDTNSGKSIVTAEVPLAEVQRYVTDLRSITQGRGIFSMEYVRHEQVPAHLTQAIIDKSKPDI